MQVWKWVCIFEARSENGCGKWYFLVWNWVWIWRCGRHTHTKQSKEYPPPPREMPWEEKAEGGKEMNFELSNIIYQKLFIYLCTVFPTTSLEFYISPVLGLRQTAMSFNHPCEFRHIPLVPCPWAVSIGNTLWESWVRCIQPGTGYSLIHGRVWLQRLRFLAVLLRNRLSILTIVVLNTLWFLHSSVKLGVCFRRSYFFIIIIKTINKPFTMS